jgi:hypothetical protein
MSHNAIGGPIASVRARLGRIWRLIALSSLVLLIALGAASPGHTQDADLKPIRLVSGEYALDVVKPAEVEVSPDAMFDGKYFKLIQFAQIPDDAERQSWEAAGLHLVDYLPDDTYFAVIDRGFDLIRLADQALTIVDVADVFRLEPKLASLRARGESTNRLVVSYYATLDAKKVIADLESRGVTIETHRDYSHQLDIVIDPARLEEIVALPYLQFLGPPPEEPVLEGYDHRNASGRSNYLNTGYNGLNYDGTDVVVGIGEGGTVDNLVDAKGRLTELETGAPSEHKIGVVQNAGGAGNLDPTNRNNAWGGTFLSIEAYPDYAGLYTSYNLRFTNHSYGAGTTPSGGYDQAARDHDLRIASLPNHLVIYSAGNSGAQTGYAPYDFPTWATITGAMKMSKNMLAIGALDSLDALTSFSSRGPMLDGRIIPQLVIEGIEGTSDAAPKMTGEVAMLAQVYKDLNGGAEPPSSLLRAVLMNTADDLGNAGPDFKTGYGRPNMRRAYNVIDNAQYLSDSVSNGDTDSYPLVVPANTKQVRVMLVWPDVAASVDANPAIVNDLNLLLEDPATTSYNPWMLDSSLPSSEAKLDAPATRGVDNLNTIEQVTVDDPAAGNWTIEVSGANVPFGPQTYYLTYEFLGDELTMAFPLQDHRFVPGTTYYLRWDSYGSSDTFSLDYQLDDGSWLSIATGVSASARVYQWTAPTVTGIHTIKFRVQRGALTAESDINYIGGVPPSFSLDWACADSVRLTWDPVAGATAYKVYKVGTQYMEEVVSGITFDGTSAILTGQSTVNAEYYAVSAVTGAYEGLRTMALQKDAGDYNCYNAKTTVASSVDDVDVTLNGWVNPHGSTLTNAHFEYGPTTAYGSSTSDIPVTATGHTQQDMSSSISSPLNDRADVLHFRLVVTVDGTPAYGDDQEIRLTPGYAFTFDGTDDYINVSDHNALPIYRNGTGTGYSITFWIKAPTPTSSGKAIYTEASSTNGNPRLVFATYSSYTGLWIQLFDDGFNTKLNYLYPMQLLDNTWHHFAWVDSNGAYKIYLDGNLSFNSTYPPSTTTLNTAALGAFLQSSASSFFQGTVDEASFWDKALSVAEVKALMHQRLQGGEANLKAYYRLDDGPANRVFDAVSAKEASIVGGSSKVFSTAPMGVLGTLVQTNAATSVGEAGKRLTVTITSGSPTTNYLGIYKTGQGATSVTGETFPSGVTERRSILWGIREYGNVTADLVFDYSTVPDISDPAAIQLLKRADATSAWTNVTSEFVHDTVNRTFTKTGETSFSEFSIGDNGENPTAVEIANFVATADDLGVRLDWETASEVDNLGFNLYRSESAEGERVPLNAALIPSQVPPGSPVGAGYSFLDETAQPGVTYLYWLETVDTHSGTALHGPVQATLSSGPYRYYLPLVVVGP